MSQNLLSILECSSHHHSTESNDTISNVMQTERRRVAHTCNSLGMTTHSCAKFAKIMAQIGTGIVPSGNQTRLKQSSSSLPLPFLHRPKRKHSSMTHKHTCMQKMAQHKISVVSRHNVRQGRHTSSWPLCRSSCCESTSCLHQAWCPPNMCNPPL